MEISKHPEMGTIISAIRKIADDAPCADCKALTDDLNGAKSRMNHWKEKYDTLRSALQEVTDEWEESLTDGDKEFEVKDTIQNQLDQIKSLLGK